MTLHTMSARPMMLACLLLVTAACDETPEQNATGANLSTNNAAAAAAPAIPAAERTAPAIVLEGEGLRLIDPATTHATPLPFGMDKAMALRGLSAGMGGAPDKVETLSDCGPGPLEVASWDKGLSAYFQDGKFVGWGGAVDLKTMDGIGFGSTRAQLVEAYHPTIEQSSLGTEFSSGGLSGILESEAPDAAISEIWAGMNCIAR
ncbi:MAG: hypothetical protein ABW048_10300 [Sphingobium sp.]